MEAMRYRNNMHYNEALRIRKPRKLIYGRNRRKKLERWSANLLSGYNRQRKLPTYMLKHTKLRSTYLFSRILLKDISQ